jgi:hypothetical protein
MQDPLLVAYRAQAIQREIDTLADAHPGGPREQQGLGAQVIAALEFFLEPLVFFGGKRSRQNLWQRREVLATNESGLEGMAVVGAVVQQAAQAKEVIAAGFVGQRRILLDEGLEPTQQMGIAAQLGEAAHLGEVGVQTGEETSGDAAVYVHGLGSQSSGQSLDMGIKNLLQAGCVRFHDRGVEDKRMRFWMALANSRQTS